MNDEPKYRVRETNIFYKKHVGETVKRNREGIDSDVEEFLKSGGKIKKIEDGVLGKDYTEIQEELRKQVRTHHTGTKENKSKGYDPK